MNPYAFSNLLRPTVAADHRVLENAPHGVGPGYAMSRAIFRAICMVENLLPGSR